MQLYTVLCLLLNLISIMHLSNILMYMYQLVNHVLLPLSQFVGQVHYYFINLAETEEELANKPEEW